MANGVANNSHHGDIAANTTPATITVAMAPGVVMPVSVVMRCALCKCGANCAMALFISSSVVGSGSFILFFSYNACQSVQMHWTVDSCGEQPTEHCLDASLFLCLYGKDL
jgi:hypothetical protein